jgi:polysaccharide export outer membrane protein
MRISVVGQVQKPGTFPYSSGLTVVEAIAAASGFSENAAADRAIVTRVVDGQVVEIPVPLQEVMRGRAPNLRLWPSDTVFVPTYQLLP